MLKLISIRRFTDNYKLIVICACLILVLYHATPTLLSNSSTGRRIKSKHNDLAIMLDRHLFFRRSPPDVRKTNLRIFNDGGVVDLFDRLLVNKLSKQPHQLIEQPEYFEFHRENETKRVVPKRTFHLGFVGDSRIRQLFALVYQVIPDYDRTVYPEETQFSSSLFVPRQMVMHSDVLNFLISFNWFSLLTKNNHGRNIFQFLHNWLDYKDYIPENKTLVRTPLPDVLVIGLGPHHMLHKHTDVQEDFYFAKLQQLVPVLRNISKYCQIIWLNQYPTNEFFGKNGADNTDVHSEKIWHYNREAVKILRNGGIPIWSSGSPIAEEYFRSCLFNNRLDGYLRNYFNCRDYIHPGLAAVTDMIQILYNIMLLKQPG